MIYLLSQTFLYGTMTNKDTYFKFDPQRRESIYARADGSIFHVLVFGLNGVFSEQEEIKMRDRMAAIKQSGAVANEPPTTQGPQL